MSTRHFASMSGTTLLGPAMSRPYKSLARPARETWPRRLKRIFTHWRAASEYEMIEQRLIADAGLDRDSYILHTRDK